MSMYISRCRCLIAVAWALLFAFACGSLNIQLPPQAIWGDLCGEKPDFIVFLVGDGGAVQLANDPVLGELTGQIEQASESIGPERIATIWLGDNIYERGLSAEGSLSSKSEEAILNAQLSSSGSGRTFVVLGNHDWRNGNAIHEIEFIERRGLDERVEVLPGRQCPFPVARDFGNTLRTIFLDTNWWLETAENATGHCKVSREDEVSAELRRQIDSAGDRAVLVAGHHPLRSMGPHGYRLVPLRQDLSSSAYRRLDQWAEDALQARDVLAWIAGHDHSLQLISGDSRAEYYIVSGSASTKKRTRVRAQAGLVFGVPRPGFQRLDAYGSGAVALTAVYLDGGEWHRVQTWLRGSR